MQHHNFSGQVIEVTLILPFHKQARAQMRCKRSKWSSNFKWPQPNYVSTSCFSISLYLWNSPSNACELSVLDNWGNWKKQYNLLLHLYLVFTTYKKDKSLYVGYEESFRDEVGLWKFLVKDGNWWLRNKKFWYNLNVLNCKGSSL